MIIRDLTFSYTLLCIEMNQSSCHLTKTTEKIHKARLRTKTLIPYERQEEKTSILNRTWIVCFFPTMNSVQTSKINVKRILTRFDLKKSKCHSISRKQIPKCRTYSWVTVIEFVAIKKRITDNSKMIVKISTTEHKQDRSKGTVRIIHHEKELF